MRKLLSISAGVALLATLLVGRAEAGDAEQNASTQPAQSASAADGPSTQAICGSGLYCSWSPANGATGCQQYSGGPTIYCCPSGYALINQSCVPPCGWGLSCGGSYVQSSNICVQRASDTTPIFCCTPGKTYTGGGCV